MKEIIELHQEILALENSSLPEEGVDFSRDVVGEDAEALPAHLQEDIRSLQGEINAVIPDDFDYVVFLGSSEEEPLFTLEFENWPTTKPDERPFAPEQSILEQLRALDWEEQRRASAESRQQMKEIMAMMEWLTKPLPSAKRLQREYREEMKDFIKEKRRDASKTHVLYLQDDGELMEADFADREAFRTALPDMIFLDSAEIITVVTDGKPLPVEKIDALKAKAQAQRKEQIYSKLDEEEAKLEGPPPDALPVEGESPAPAHPAADTP
jgi:hypothetical protein